MKKLIIILLVIFASNGAFAQSKPVDAVKGTIELTPAKVFIPSTGDYVYLVETKPGIFAFFISKDAKIFERFTSKGNDSLVRLQGAVFKPLTHYTKKQWRRLSKEIKLFFPSISHEELEKMDFYMIFNYAVELKQSASGRVNNTFTENGTGQTGGNRKQENGVWYKEVTLPNGVKVWQRE